MFFFYIFFLRKVLRGIFYRPGSVSQSALKDYPRICSDNNNNNNNNNNYNYYYYHQRYEMYCYNVYYFYIFRVIQYIVRKKRA